jgi:hypothetical protein
MTDFETEFDVRKLALQMAMDLKPKAVEDLVSWADDIEQYILGGAQALRSSPLSSNKINLAKGN